MKNRRPNKLWTSILLLFLVLIGVGRNQYLDHYSVNNQEIYSQEQQVLDEEELEELTNSEFEDEDMEIWDGSTDQEDEYLSEDSPSANSHSMDEDGAYTEKYEVAAYIYEYGHLPSNYITKKEARELGWDSQAGNLDEVAPGKSIGGDVYKNYEKMLPEESGRVYYECDVEYDGGYRNEKRLLYSNDGLVFYTGDHYKTFEQIY